MLWLDKNIDFFTCYDKKVVESLCLTILIRSFDTKDVCQLNQLETL